MNELKVAVSITGRIVILEQFPDDEEHAGLHEMLVEFDCDGVESEDPPGLYMATFYIENKAVFGSMYNDHAYLEISKLETIPDYFNRICLESGLPDEEMESSDNSNVVDLSAVRNAKNANENLQHALSSWDGVTPEEAAEQEALKTAFDNERKHAAALNKSITLGDEWDSKDIYLTKPNQDPHEDDYIVGLHAIGHAGQHQYTVIELDQSRTVKSTDFASIDAWGNEYDKNHNILGRGSFRVTNPDIEEEAKKYEDEGWTRCEKPGKVSRDT